MSSQHVMSSTYVSVRSSLYNMVSEFSTGGHLKKMLLCRRILRTNSSFITYTRYCGYRRLAAAMGSQQHLNYNPVRTFSKFSTDSNEAVVKESKSSHLGTQQLLSNASSNNKISLTDETDHTKPSMDYLKPARKKMEQLLSLKDSYLTLSKTSIDAQILLKNNSNASTPDELVAMADCFLLLVNRVELEASMETIQTLQHSEELVDGDSVTKELLAQAQRALYRLHSVFLKVVDSCVPFTAKSEMDNLPSATFVDPSLLSKYSALTMEKALQVSRRAEELGMPMHKPLYQRMAVGIVLHSPLPLPKDPGQWPWDRDRNSTDERVKRYAQSETDSTLDSDVPKLVSPGICPSPLVMELFNICHRAKVALKCSVSPSVHLIAQIEQSQQQYALEVDMYSEPWLLMLKRRQFEEALGLVNAWQFSSSHSKINVKLLSLFGEDIILKALDIAKEWVVGTSFPDEVTTNPYASELIRLLQFSLSQILRRRRVEADKLSNMINALAAMQAADENEDDEFSESDSDFDDEGDELLYDSDSDDEDDDNAFNDMDMDVTCENFPLLLKGVGSYSAKAKGGERMIEPSEKFTEIKINVADNDSPDVANLNPVISTSDGIEKEYDESPIIKGFSNEEVRRSIYLRKGPVWELPDVVSQLEDWNKGKSLNFTPEFEKHLAWEMAKEEEDHWT